MPEIHFEGQVVQCQAGANLRRVLMKAGLPIYNGIARAIHCRGLGTCGTCAVQVTPLAESGADGSEVLTAMTAVETWRLSFPPHRADAGLRLACQCEVHGDIRIVKHDGMWGHRKKSS